MVLSNGSGGEADRGGSAADEKLVVFLQAEGFEQRAPRRLQHLWDSAQCLPWDFGPEHLHLRRAHTGIFCVAAVSVSAHAAHGCRYNVPPFEIRSGGIFDKPDCFDAEDSGELDAWRMALAGEELGTIESKGFDADEDFARYGRDSTLRFSAGPAV